MKINYLKYTYILIAVALIVLFGLDYFESRDSRNLLIVCGFIFSLYLTIVGKKKI